MIDIHNHILPAVDDGASDIGVSLGMLQEAERQGVETLVLTPHLYEPDIIKGTGDWRSKIETAHREVMDLVEAESLNIEIVLAAEIRFQGLLDVILDELPVIIGGKYILLEFSFSSVPLHVEQAVYGIFRRGITPILAHPERIKPWQRDPAQLAELINMGCLSQLDIGSFLGRLGPSSEALALKLLEEGAVNLVGSDSHNLTSRPVFAREGHDWLTEHYGPETADLYLKGNPARILRGEAVETFSVYLEQEETGIMDRIKNLFR